MILIEDVKFTTVQNNPTEVVTFYKPAHEYEPCNLEIPMTMPHAETELVHGREYAHPNGRKSVIGMTKKVQDKLGMPFDEMTKLVNQVGTLEARLHYEQTRLERVQDISIDLRHRIRDLRSHRLELKAKISTYENAGFLRRLKFLFTGEV